MRVFMLILVMAVSLCVGGVSFAGKSGNSDSHKKDNRGPSDRAYERANDNAAFKRTENWEPGVHPDKPRNKKRDLQDGEHKERKDKHKRKHKKDDDHNEEDDPVGEPSDLETPDGDLKNDPLSNQTGG